MGSTPKPYAQEFIEKGYCIIPRAIDESLIALVNHQINAFRKRNDGLLDTYSLLVEGMLNRVVNLHFSVTSLQQVFCQAMSAGAEVVDFYGRATLYTSLFFELGSQQALHRDTPYFYSGVDEGYMGVWVALDDVNENNGALIVVEGSHKLPEPDLIALREKFHPGEKVPPSSPALFDAYNQVLCDAAKACGLSTNVCNVNRGDMILWHPSTLHGGLHHNDKSRTRRSFVMHITPKNMPIKHMDYFFDRSKVINPVEKTYLPIGSDRLISAGDQIDFRHVKSFSSKELGVL